MSESPTSCPSGSRSKRSDVRDIRCKTAEKSVSNSSLSTVKKTKMTTIPTKLLSSDSIETTPARFNSSFRSKKTKTPTIPSKLPSSDKIGLPPVPPKISTKTPMSKADTPQRRRRISSAGKVLHDRALRKTSRKSTSSRLVGRHLTLQLERCQHLPLGSNFRSPDATVVATILSSQRVRSEPVVWLCANATADPIVCAPRKFFSRSNKGRSPIKDPLIIHYGDRVLFEVFDRRESGTESGTFKLIATGTLDLSDTRLKAGADFTVSLQNRRLLSIESKRRRGNSNFERLHRRYAPSTVAVNEGKSLKYEKSRPAAAINECSLDLKICPSTPEMKTKTIWFVRHAQSQWNQGQKQWNPFMLLGHLDHGLSRVGRTQAIDLWDRICTMPQRVGERVAAGDVLVNVEEELTSWRNFLNASCVMSSPMTRALQTALLALRGLPIVQRSGIRLMATAREVKNSIGSLDCVGVAKGSAIRWRALDGLKSHHTSPSSSPTFLSRKRPSRDLEVVVDDDDSDDDDGVLAQIRDIEIVSNDCEHGEWWTRKKDHDDDADVLRRLECFLYRLRYGKETSTIVVSHSCFLMRLVEAFSSASFRSSSSGMFDDLAHRKIENCGVVQLELRFPDDGSVQECIQNARLVFGTAFSKSHQSDHHKGNRD